MQHDKLLEILEESFEAAERALKAQGFDMESGTGEYTADKRFNYDVGNFVTLRNVENESDSVTISRNREDRVYRVYADNSEEFKAVLTVNMSDDPSVNVPMGATGMMAIKTIKERTQDINSNLNPKADKPRNKPRP